MNSELAGMLDNPAHWSQHAELSTFGPFWHHHSSTVLPRFYYSGRPSTFYYGNNVAVRFTTEEWSKEQALDPFVGSGSASAGWWPTIYQSDVTDYINERDLFAACDSEGRLFTWGQDFGPPTQNALGHGPDASGWEGFYARRRSRFGPTLVLGENGELADVRFVKCGIGYVYDITTSALSDTGVLYISGASNLGAHGIANSAPRHYHKPLLGYTWKTYSHGPFGIVAIDSAGNAYTWGPSVSAYGDGLPAYEHPTLIENTFVQELTIQHGGSGNWQFLGIDPPQQSGGRQATALLFRSSSNGPIVQAAIAEPGSGYTSPPALRFAGDSQAVLPVITSSLFSSSWKSTYQESNGFGSSFSALISEDGYLYTYGASTIEPTVLPTASPQRFSHSPRKYLDRKIAKVVGNTQTTAAIGEDGALYVWTNNAVIPGASRRAPITFSEGPFVDVAAGLSEVLAIRFDGRVFGIGRNLLGQLGVGDRSPRTELTQVAGSLRAKRVFRGRDSFVVLRDQTYDAAGNPIYAT